MNEIVKLILMAAVQTGIAFVGGILVEHHVINGAQEQTLIAWTVNHAVLAAPVLAALALTLWNKYRGRVKMLTALMPGVHTEDQVNAILKSGAPTPTILTPPSTSPGVPTPAPIGLTVDMTKVGKL